MASIHHDIQYKVYVDEVSSTLVYVGYAERGTEETANAWIIYKIETTGTVTKQLTVDGLLLSKSRWDLRATYTYL